MSISAGIATGRMRNRKMKKEDLSKTYFQGDSVHFNPKRRQCKFCSKVLSIYNLNNFCFAHMYKGLKMEHDKEGEKRFKQMKKAQSVVTLRNQRKRKGAKNG